MPKFLPKFKKLSEFGLVPIEAAALGVPAVCYAKGEVLNIMKSYG